MAEVRRSEQDKNEKDEKDEQVSDEEQTQRAAGSHEGGGAWPPELLGRFLQATPVQSVEHQYTSHEK